eukprot:gnl/Hemi2/22647_TR7557_c1_g1_i1.p1 gnl/Hemi2/22647_TR7557_c1_g1~~gnl/Hemi2/22647_TR7557_c1_g1_i1.p1  ORF type:complete len:261 (+),score=64.00 gnl/Hemi2/22647_TR7557_c1_g1_i1:51-833(+)
MSAPSPDSSSDDDMGRRALLPGNNTAPPTDKISGRYLLDQSPSPPPSCWRSVGIGAQMLWGLGVSVWVLAMAISGLVPHALDTLRYSMNWYQWLCFGSSCLLLGYFEGYRAFHLSFSPMLVARSLHLAVMPPQSSCLYWTIMALYPFYCYALFKAPVRRMVVSWLVVLMVGGLIAAVHFLAVPWRGIVDGGVIVGLGMGTLSCLYYALLAYIHYPASLSGVVPQLSRPDFLPVWVAVDSAAAAAGGQEVVGVVDGGAKFV